MHAGWSEHIQERTARIGVVVRRYEGLPLGLALCEASFPVAGFDLAPAKARAIARGESYIKHIVPERVAAAVATGCYQATTDFGRLAERDDADRGRQFRQQPSPHQRSPTCRMT